MNAHGRAGRAARIAGAITALLLTHAAAADDTMIVYGKRIATPEAGDPAPPQFDSAAFLAALHDDIRASLRDGLRALRLEIARQDGTEVAQDEGKGRAVEVASLGTRGGV